MFCLLSRVRRSLSASRTEAQEHKGKHRRRGRRVGTFTRLSLYDTRTPCARKREEMICFKVISESCSRSFIDKSLWKAEVRPSRNRSVDRSLYHYRLAQVQTLKKRIWIRCIQVFSKLVESECLVWKNRFNSVPPWPRGIFRIFFFTILNRNCFFHGQKTVLSFFFISMILFYGRFGCDSFLCVCVCVWKKKERKMILGGEGAPLKAPTNRSPQASARSEILEMSERWKCSASDKHFSRTNSIELSKISPRQARAT